MLAVTVGTYRRHRIAPLCGRAMQAVLMRPLLASVTITAFDEFQVLSRGMTSPVRVYISVTFDAGQIGMHGCRVSILCHEYRYVDATAGSGEFLVGVACETVRIVLGCCGDTGKEQPCCGEDRPGLSGAAPVNSTSWRMLALLQRDSRFVSGTGESDLELKADRCRLR